MKTSVVIATYNRPALLFDLLDDLSRQVGMDAAFDVTIVDDGSAHPVKQQLEQRRWPFPLRIIEQKNAGQSSARQAGVLASDGELVVIIDDDMRVAPDFLVTHRTLHERGYEVVLGLIRAPGDLSTKPLFERFHAAQLAAFLTGMRQGKPIPGAALCTGNCSFRRQRYLQVGGFDVTLQRSEDRDLGIRLKKAGAKFAFSERANAIHRSDHRRHEVWLRRAYLYGVYDTRISSKYPDDGYNDPWHFLVIVNPLVSPILLGAALAPKLAEPLAELALRVAGALDRLGLEPVALKGVTLAYGLQYYRGVRAEHPQLAAAARSLIKFFGKKNAFERDVDA